MWYWIIAGSIFLIFQILAFLSFTPLKNKYKFFEFINNLCAGADADKSIDDINNVVYIIITASIAIFFPLVIVFIVSYFIICFSDSILKNLKGKIKK
jgi:dolichol kinase